MKIRYYIYVQQAYTPVIVYATQGINIHSSLTEEILVL